MLNELLCLFAPFVRVQSTRVILCAQETPGDHPSDTFYSSQGWTRSSEFFNHLSRHIGMIMNKI